jgi:hypothetical protein
MRYSALAKLGIRSLCPLNGEVEIVGLARRSGNSARCGSDA